MDGEIKSKNTLKQDQEKTKGRTKMEGLEERKKDKSKIKTKLSGRKEERKRAIDRQKERWNDK